MTNNTEFINKQISFISSKLNELNIEFYIVGAIGAYIDANIPLQRAHDDLDLMIEETNIDKLNQVFKDTEFEFHDNRFTSDKVLNQYGYPEGEHEVFAKLKNSDFHIGFFIFYRKENTYTICEYFNQDGKQKKLERTLPIEIFNFQYNPSPINYLKNNIRVVRKELIYKNKFVMNREKDLFDIKMLEQKIDKHILENLKGLSKIRKTTIIDI